MTKSATYFSLFEACEKDGCPLCRVEHDAALKFLDTLFYEQINEFEMRERLRKSLGLCHEHAWLSADRMTGNALGLAILYDDMLRVRLEQLNEKKGKQHLVPIGKCPACEQKDSVGHRALTVLARHLAEEEMRESVARSDGLCFHHLPLALEQIKDSSVKEELLSIHKDKMEKLRAELGEFIRKNDYRFINEGFGAERDAWRRAVTMGAGKKRLEG
jgi:Family of unknown function (DUF6062)